LCVKPELATQATLDAALDLKTDAAIIFSDITVLGWAMGLQLDFAPGPRFAKAVRSAKELHALKQPDPSRDLDFVLEAIRLTRKQLPQDVSLIGFCAAPLTLACYLMEGVPSHDWHESKKLIYGDPKFVHQLLEFITPIVAAHAQAQIQAGCDTIQLFDSMAGHFAEAELYALAFSYARKVFMTLRPLNAATIYFGRNIGAHLEGAIQTGAHVLGLDWTVSIANARRRLGDDSITLMGNLDPVALLCEKQTVQQRVKTILEEAKGAKSFIFNLGHGVLPPTDPNRVREIVKLVHDFPWA